METVADVLGHKGTTVHSAPPEARVLEAVERMCEAHVGAVLIASAGVPLGIFTERDLMRRVILAQKSPATTLVGDVMTTDVVCIDPSTPIRQAMAIMTDRRCRHLPVLSGGRVTGMISIGDLVRCMTFEQAFEIQVLTDYVRGAYA